MSDIKKDQITTKMHVKCATLQLTDENHNKSDAALFIKRTKSDKICNASTANNLIRLSVSTRCTDAPIKKVQNEFHYSIQNVQKLLVKLISIILTFFI